MQGNASLDVGKTVSKASRNLKALSQSHDSEAVMSYNNFKQDGFLRLKKELNKNVTSLDAS